MENYIKADNIAKNAGIKHESINRAIARHRDQLQTFGPLGRTKGGRHGRTVYYWLNRAQAALLITMLKNSGAGVRLKATLLTELLATA